MMKLRIAALASLLMLASCGGGDSNDNGDAADTAAAGDEDGGEIVPTPAEGYFPLEPGLWERTSVAVIGTPPAVERICIDAATRNRITPVNELRGIASGCKPIEQSGVTMFGVVFRLQCTDPAAEVGGALRFENGALMTDINLSKGDEGLYSGRASAKRIGECPAGMNPGDVSDASGKVTGSING